MAHDRQFRDFARVGAALRLAEMADETKMIVAAFPELRNPKRRQALVARATAAPVREPAVVQAVRTKRRRRKLTAAEKKNISARIKVYWAERKRRAA